MMTSNIYIMKKCTIYIRVSLVFLMIFAGVSSFAQVQVQGGTVDGNNINAQNPFLDASSFYDQSLDPSSAAKGFVFPRVDLTSWEFAVDLLFSGSTFFPSFLDGMIVYNSGTGNTSVTGNNPSVSTAVRPGFYLFSNPDGATNTSITDGKWVRLNDSQVTNLPSGASLPAVASSIAGDVFYDTTQGLMVFDGTAWVSISLASISHDSSLTGDGSSGSPLGLADGGVTSAKLYNMGASSGQVLTFNGSNWLPANPAAGGITSLATPSGSNANAGSISGNTLTLSLADATNPGIVSTGAQTLAGDKTLSGNTILSGTAALNGNTTLASGKNLTLTGLNSSMLKTNASGVVSAAVAGTDYQTALTNPVTASAATASSGQLAVFNGSGTQVTATTILPTAAVPAFTGDVVNTAGSLTNSIAKLQGTTLTISGLAASNLLQYNGTAWVNVTPASALGSVLTAGTGISISGTTISNAGVTSFSGGTTGLTPSSSSVGALTLGGTLGVANGGTGATTLTSYGVLYGNGASAVQAVAPGTSGYVLTSTGTGSAPAWASLPSSSSPISSLLAATAVNTIANANFAQTWNWGTANTQSPLTLGGTALTTGNLLTLNGGSALTSGSLLYASGAVSASTTAGLINVYNTAASTTGKVATIQANSTAGSGLTVLASGNVGIGTATPGSTLEVTGAAVNTAPTVGTTATINFGVNNLAYTSYVAASPAFTLSNMKNGGAYTLVLTGTTNSGTASFTASGLTGVKYMGTGTLTSGKTHIFSFIVVGGYAYITMATEN